MSCEIARATYLTDVGRLSLGECRRFGNGFTTGALFWIFARFVKPQGEMELPNDYDDFEATPEEMSANFNEVHASWRLAGPARRDARGRAA